MHKKAKELSTAMARKGKKIMTPAEKKMGHKVSSAAHKRMVGTKGRLLMSATAYNRYAMRRWKRRRGQ